MNLASAVGSRTMEALPWTLDLAFPDVGELLPLGLLCVGSILCMTLWLLAVSSHISRSKAHRYGQ